MRKPSRKNKNWKILLLELYYHVPDKYVDLKNMTIWDSNHDLVHALPMDGLEVGAAMRALIDYKLVDFDVKKTKPYRAEYTLTEKGFNVAYELDKNQKHVTIELVGLGLAAFFAIGFVVQTGAILDVVSGQNLLYMYFFSIIVIFLIMVFYVRPRLLDT